MNFNLDDPLADLLSDNDNDSFFENYKKGTKSAPVKTIATESRDQPVNKSNSGAAINKNPAATSTPRIAKNAEILLGGIGDNDDDDDLGFDPKKPKALNRGADILDDILGAIEANRPATAKPALARESAGDTSDMAHMQFRPKTATGRRASGHSVVTNPDPLGIFSMSKKEKGLSATATEKETPKPKKRGTTADWLGLSVTSEQNIVASGKDAPQSESFGIDKSIEINSEESKEIDESHLKITAEITPKSAISETFLQVPPPIAPQSVAPAKNIALLNTMNVETQNAYNVLQQQEFQLTLATQMKQQEQALMEMQCKQECLLHQQEQQFNNLLQQQIQRQQQLEEHIKSQQQRITSHIQLLMTQPALVAPPLKPLETMEDGKTETVVGASELKIQRQSALETVQLEADVKRLELEKLRLEELVESLKGNHEKEIEMIESSFRKQLKVLEENLGAVEARLRNEIGEQHTFYGKKLEVLLEDKEKLKSDYEAQIASLKQEHDDDIRKLRKSQEDNLEMLKEEHRHMLETLRQAKLLEFGMMQENGSYLEALKAASSNLADVSGDLQGLRDEMQTKIDLIHRERVQKLDAREKRLEDGEKRLQLTEASAEDERRRLMELVSSLEVQLEKKTKEAAEENWLLRQQMATLEAERTALAREKVSMREQFARDEKRIADLKEQQLAETQRQMLDIQDERNRLNVEQTKFETQRRLQTPFDVEKQRMEIEATLQVAEQAARQADAERMRYHRMQRELEQKKRELVEEGNMLRAKEDEVDQELQAMRLAERKSLDTQQKAQAAEQSFQAKIQFLQQRMREVAEKESQLSQEQLFLAQERIKLQNLKKRITDQKCTLCQMSERNSEMVQMLYATDANACERVSSAADMAGGGSSGTGVVRAENVGDAGGEKYRNMLMNRGNVVERMLDGDIAESYRRMRQTFNNPDHWSELVMDDDTKEKALHNLDADAQMRNASDANK